MAIIIFYHSSLFHAVQSEGSTPPSLAFVFNFSDSEMKTPYLFLEPNPFVDALSLYFRIFQSVCLRNRFVLSTKDILSEKNLISKRDPQVNMALLLDKTLTFFMMVNFMCQIG